MLGTGAATRSTVKMTRGGLEGNVERMEKGSAVIKNAGSLNCMVG